MLTDIEGCQQLLIQEEHKTKFLNSEITTHTTTLNFLFVCLIVTLFQYLTFYVFTFLFLRSFVLTFFHIIGLF